MADANPWRSAAGRRQGRRRGVLEVYSVGCMHNDRGTFRMYGLSDCMCAQYCMHTIYSSRGPERFFYNNNNNIILQLAAAPRAVAFALLLAQVTRSTQCHWYPYL